MPAKAVAALPVTRVGLDHDRAVGDGERNVRPIGASLWLRWPEFGYGLRPASGFDPAERLVDFVGWRGDRDVRNWPKQLRAGSLWPWEDVPQETRWGVAS